MLNEMRPLIWHSLQQLLTQPQMEQTAARLRPLIKKAEQACLHKQIQAQEQIWLVTGDAESPTPFFSAFEFTADHRLRDATELKHSLSAYDELCDVEAHAWFAATEKALQVGLAHFAQHLRLTGSRRLRIQVKSLIHHQEQPRKVPSKIGLSLAWHYDYWAQTTLAFPLYSSFPERAGEHLLLAENAYEARPLNGEQGPNHLSAEPRSGTMIKVEYPERGALLFDGQRGAQIHSPAKQVLAAGAQGVFSRTLIQIVLLDEGWRKQC